MSKLNLHKVMFCFGGCFFFTLLKAQEIDQKIGDLKLNIAIQEFDARNFLSKNAANQFKISLCNELGNRLNLGGGLLNSGVFTEFTCNSENSQQADANLKISSNGQKFELKTYFGGIESAVTTSLSIPLGKIHPQILLEKDLLDTIAFRLLNAMPFIGRLNKGEEFDLKTKYKASTTQELLSELTSPKQIVFFNLKISSGIFLSHIVGRADINPSKISRKVLVSIFEWIDSTDEEEVIYFHLASGPKSLNKKLDQIIASLLERKSAKFPREDHSSEDINVVTADDEFRLGMSRYLMNGNAILNKIQVYSEALDFRKGVLQGLSLQLEQAPRVNVISDLGRESFQYQRANLSYGPLFNFSHWNFYISPVVELSSYNANLLLDLQDGNTYGIKEYNAPTTLAGGWRLGGQLITKKVYIALRYENIFYQVAKGTNTHVKSLSTAAEFKYIFRKLTKDSRIRPFLMGYTRYSAIMFSNDFDDEIQTRLDLNLNSFSVGLGGGILW